MKPTIETAKKLSDALSVSLDYLAGDSDLKVADKKTMQRLVDIEKFLQEDKAHIFYALDNLIKAAKYKAFKNLTDANSNNRYHQQQSHSAFARPGTPAAYTGTQGTTTPNCN